MKQETIDRIRKFTSDRDWEQYHTPANLAKSISIGAASIFAKVTRDRLMMEYDARYPEYGFAKNVGYGTAEHIEALKFQWSDTDFDIDHVKEELADVLVYCRNMLDELGLDEDEIINSKMDKNEAKYPVELAKGSAEKYTELKKRK